MKIERFQIGDIVRGICNKHTEAINKIMGIRKGNSYTIVDIDMNGGLILKNKKAPEGCRFSPIGFGLVRRK